MSLTVNGIYSEICNEGKFLGFPTTFVSLAKGKKRRMSVETIVNSIVKMRNRHVCIVGEEPLIQDESYPLIYELVDKGYHVSVEATCCFQLVDVRNIRSFFYTVLVHCPSSSVEFHNIYDNLSLLSPKDEVRFNISDLEDYVFSKEVMKSHPTKANIILTPVPKGKDSTIMKDLPQWIIEDKPYKVRLGVTYTN